MCPKCGDNTRSVVRCGLYQRKTGRIKVIQRYLCRVCGSKFSNQTSTLTYRERKPHLTQSVLRLLMEGVSQRGIARHLKCSPITVARKMVRLGRQAQSETAATSSTEINKASTPISTVQFDEMETFEHSKCKPLSIAVAVDERSRLIIAASVAVMPCPGKLSKISRKKYGYRPDQRKECMIRVLSEVRRLCPHVQVLKSDKCSRYPRCVKLVFGDNVSHKVFKGRRSRSIGQGELKRGRHDPIFALNHTCAMFRDRIKRLARRTWTTTKRKERLADLVSLYAWWHNKQLMSIKKSCSMPNVSRLRSADLNINPC